MNTSRHLGWLWRELWSHRTAFAGAIFCTAVSAGLFLLIPVWAGHLVAVVFPGLDIAVLARHLALGLVLFTAGALFSFGRTYLMISLSQKITSTTRIRLFRHILGVSPRTAADAGGGELVSSFSNDLQVFQEALTRVVSVFAPALILLVVFGAAMAWYTWPLFLCAMVLISPLVLVTSYFGRKLHGVSHSTQEQLATLVAEVTEMLGGLKEIKSCNRESDVAVRFDALNAEALRVQLDYEKMDAFHPVAVTLAAGAGITVLIFLSALFLQQGIITLEVLTSFMACAALAYSPAQEASHSMGRLMQLFAVMDRFNRIHLLPPEKEGRKRLSPELARGEIEFDGINFSYPGSNFSMRHFSMRISAGEKVALVGPSGGGKSTILDFIPRFLVPDSGTLLVDGLDVSDLKLRDLRQVIGEVYQEPIIFAGTLLDNLRFGAPEASLEEVRRAAEAAHVAEFADKLLDGYLARIEPRGANLSVGQRQRIAIARIFLRDPRILLLDEPTSALDAESERLVREALQRAWQGRTALIVAHRLATVHAVDRIVVIDAGRIVEEGSHRELYQSGGLYYRLYREQLCREQEETELAPA
ncbi:MAG: ABC transporter ATP-binding protein [Deltaproteobacteria bacterium]|nr:ABC transporter ATP-binding protein [Deltaproteobacteria bacterium]